MQVKVIQTPSSPPGISVAQGVNEVTGLWPDLGFEGMVARHFSLLLGRLPCVGSIDLMSAQTLQAPQAQIDLQQHAACALRFSAHWLAALLAVGAMNYTIPAVLVSRPSLPRRGSPPAEPCYIVTVGAKKLGIRWYRHAEALLGITRA